MKDKDRLRLSYSFLLCWSQGRIDDALALYFHKPMPKSKAMQDGIDHHEKWAKQIKEENKLNLGKSEFTFKAPKVEEKIIAKYNDKWDISGTIDCLDNKIVYEFKTGTTDGLEYASSYQLPMYFLLCELSGVEVDKGLLIHHNQHNAKTEVIIVWNHTDAVEKARNLIDSLAPEIEDYFIANNLL